MFPPVFQKLKDSTAVMALVSKDAKVRIYRHGRAPQPSSDAIPSEPYITWQIVVGVPENNLSDPPPMDRQTVQIDMYHQTDKGIVDLAIAVRNAIEPYAHMTGQPVDEQERETNLFHIAQEFDWFVPR